MHCKKFLAWSWNQTPNLSTFYLFHFYLQNNLCLGGCCSLHTKPSFCSYPAFSYTSLAFAPLTSTQWSEWISAHNVAMKTSCHTQSDSDSLCLTWTPTVTFSLLSHFFPCSPLICTHQPSSCFPRHPTSSCLRTFTLRALLSRMFYPTLLQSWLFEQIQQFALWSYA